MYSTCLVTSWVLTLAGMPAPNSQLSQVQLVSALELTVDQDVVRLLQHPGNIHIRCWKDVLSSKQRQQ